MKKLNFSGSEFLADWITPPTWFGSVFLYVSFKFNKLQTSYSHFCPLILISDQ